MASAPRWGFDLAPLVRAVATTGLGDARPAGLPSAPLGDDSWDQLLSDVARHRLTGLLVASVAREELPVTAAQRAAVAALEVELTSARMWHEVRSLEIIELLEGAGVATRVLKGPALAALDYPDRQWRPTQDLDLLVHGEDLARASEVLCARGGLRTDPDPVAGYGASVAKGATVAMADGLEVDLHRLLVWGPLGVRLPADELWSSSRELAWGTSLQRTLGLEETLIHACCHLLVMGWRRALTLRDVVQVLANPALDVERLLGLARRWGQESVLATGLLLAVRELGLLKDVRSDVDTTTDDLFGERAIVMSWAAGFSPPMRDRLWLRVERPGDPIGALEAVATYLELGSRDARLTLARATFRPEPGTYPSPRERAQRVATRSFTSVTRPAGFRRMKLPRRAGGILGGPHGTR